MGCASSSPAVTSAGAGGNNLSRLQISRGAIVKLMADVDEVELKFKEAEMDSTPEVLAAAGGTYTVAHRVPPNGSIDIIAVQVTVWGKETLVHFPVTAIADIITPATKLGAAELQAIFWVDYGYDSIVGSTMVFEHIPASAAPRGGAFKHRFNWCCAMADQYAAAGFVYRQLSSGEEVVGFVLKPEDAKGRRALEMGCVRQCIALRKDMLHTFTPGAAVMVHGLWQGCECLYPATIDSVNLPAIHGNATTYMVMYEPGAPAPQTGSGEAESSVVVMPCACEIVTVPPQPPPANASAATFAIGLEVLARWREDVQHSAWFQATVVEENSVGGLAYSVAYDDGGEVEEAVMLKWIRKEERPVARGALEKGQRVLGNEPHESSTWLDGTIVDVQANGRLVVQYDNGDYHEDVKPTALLPMLSMSAGLTTGMRVQVRVFDEESGVQSWGAGVITAVDGAEDAGEGGWMSRWVTGMTGPGEGSVANGPTYTVRHDDGEVEEGVMQECIRYRALGDLHAT